MKEIPLTRGKIAIVDDDDYELLFNIPWYFNGRGYAMNKSRFFDEKGNRLQIFMHRLIINAPEGLEVDHINHNTLDNRKQNLRLANRYQNIRNTRRPKTNTSGYKGVTKSKNGNWIAQLSFENKNIHIGTFDNKIDAAKAYNLKALELFGEFANLNPVSHSDFVIPIKTKSSRYRGVSRKINRWIAAVYINGKRKDLGSFISEHDAARMYNFWAKDIYGDKAKLNAIKEEEI